MLRSIKFLLPLMLCWLAVACSPKTAGEIPQQKVERRKTNELVASLDSLSQLRPRYFYTKIKCEFTDTNKHVSFRTSIRMVKDSAINTLITYASIPVVNALITPDSVLVSNRQNKCVIRRDMSFIREQFGVSFDYRNIEELFLGLPVGFDTTQKYFQIHDPYNYILSTHKKREIRREDRNNGRGGNGRDRDRDDNKPDRDRDRDRDDNDRRDRNNDDNDDDDVILKYYLSADRKAVKRISIDSPNDTTTIDVEYATRDSIGSYLIPHDVYIRIRTPRNFLQLDLRYDEDKSEVNVPQEMIFVIPEEYGECEEK